MRNRFASREDAQAMIFFAVVSAVLALTMGLVIEGGRAFVQYRSLQAAADMSAIVGAQALPCGLTDTGCMTAAETLACQTAASNGFSTCSNGTGPGAFVPPITCSPYDSSIDYGNDNGDPTPYGNASCKSTTAPVSSYDYIEVQLSSDLGNVPIFNVPVTLSAHAVARHGVPSPKDFAVSQLHRTGGQFSVGGSFTFFVNGSTFANGTFSLGGQSDTACEGGFFTAQSSPTSQGSAQTFSGGIAGFAPPACYLSNGATPQTVSVPDYDSSLPPITDPYCSSVSAPYSGLKGTDCHGTSFGASTMPNCVGCDQLGWYYDDTTSKWSQASIDNNGNGGDTYEMFPGVYGNFNLGTNDYVYMNPGVYTFTGRVGFDKGNVCVFGAPICKSGKDSGKCGDTSLAWTPGPTAGSNATGNQWYYKCSPYGFYDTWLPRPATAAGGAATVSCTANPPVSHSGPSCIAPTWWDDSATNNLGINGGVGGFSAIPLNGMTWQFTSAASRKIGGNGSGNSALAYYLASPNPCPGTGSGWVAGNTAVSFNNGDPVAQYSYTSTSTDTLLYQRHITYPLSPSQSPIVSGWGSQIYPSMDLKTSGECSPDHLEVWPGEMGGKGQHLHFAMFDRQANLDKFTGNQGQSFMGILYFPGTGTSGSTFDVTGAGSSGGGIPFIFGQLVAWDISFGGNGTVDLIYRPCDDKQDVCASGLGTQLIQ